MIAVEPITIARVALPFAVALGVSAFVGNTATGGWSLLALVPAGALIVTRGALMLSQPHSVLEPLARRERAKFWGQAGLTIEHPFGAAMLLIIGMGWMAFGLLYALG